ncbi:Valine--tRNA ligase [Eumeta japonica]|uniref:valine--tRNA ligase n=1 Tax=Eumeta variegata TaxID=151549 RepID=A0A4C1UII6_EUMVA|nr:Valine--tRNA ligase [Eumeta japonica]
MVLPPPNITGKLHLGHALTCTVQDVIIRRNRSFGYNVLWLPGIDHAGIATQMFHLAYKLSDRNEEIVVSTTMPETMLGDVAIAVHPDDERYKHLHGAKVVHPFRNETIPVIFDKFVDMNFGTGAVKITPAHSKIDYEVRKRHNLPLLQVIDEDGCMSEKTGKFSGMKKYFCREKILKDLNELGLLRDTVPHSMTVPICSRTGDVIEYLPKEQWFLSCTKLNKLALKALESGQLKIIPEKYSKNLYQWIEGNIDWCISRQLWWGQQIPAYKCVAGEDLVWIAASNEQEAKEEASKVLFVLPSDIIATRDTDVLDTWFSSGIYPFASLGWPDESLDFEKFYPLDLMVTGHDILGFWVHRMIILGLELTEQLPFNRIFLHGIVCDSKGAKMSKSRGNVIDPIDVINGINLNDLNSKSIEMYKNGIISKDELDKVKTYHKTNYSNTNGIPECGVDALRFTMLSSDIKSHYVNFDIHICHSNKLFCNKIWQSIKYTQMSFSKLSKLSTEITRDDLNYFDRWILSRLAHMVKTVNDSLDNYDFHLATKALRSMIYNEFCDVYLETTKPGFENGDIKMAYAHAHTLSAVLNTSLRCLAPFMIYLTHEVIPKIPGFVNNVIYNFYDNIAELHFPITEDFEFWIDKDLDTQVVKIIDTIHLIRQIKALYDMTNKIKPSVYIQTKDETFRRDVQENKLILETITRCSDLHFDIALDNKKYVRTTLSEDIEIAVELVADDISKAMLLAKAKLEKKMKKVEDYINKLEIIVSSSNYSDSVSKWTQVEDKRILSEKKQELKQLRRLITL